MESCKVVQQFRLIKGMTDEGGRFLVERRWADGEMSCSCSEPAQSQCKTPPPNYLRAQDPL